MKLNLSVYTKRAIVGGLIATIFTGLGTLLLGNLSGYEAKQLIESSLPGVNTFFNTIVLASATILALLLTVMSISSGSKSNLKEDHYIYVLKIARLVTIVFITSITSFLLLNLPITESEDVPSNWFSYIYYISIALAAIHCGAIISVVLMLYSTVGNIIKIIGLKDSDHPLVENEEDN